MNEKKNEEKWIWRDVIVHGAHYEMLLEEKNPMYWICTLSAFLQYIWMIFFSLSIVFFLLYTLLCLTPVTAVSQLLLWLLALARCSFLLLQTVSFVCVCSRSQFRCIEFHCPVWTVWLRAFTLLVHIRVSSKYKFNVHRK